MNKHPLISIIIPVFNRSNMLKNTISSVLKQTYQNFEILICDDFSTEDILTILNGFNDKRIKYFKLEKKGNANVARNLGINNAKGEYIAMLDSDDEWMPIHLKRRLKKITKEDCDGIFGSAYVRRDKEKDNLLFSRPFHKNELMINYLLSDGSATTPTQFYKTECAKDILWNERLLRHQDYDFSCRFAEKYKFCNDIKPTVIIHLNHKSSLSDKQFESCITFANKQKINIDENNYSKYVLDMYKTARESKSKKYMRIYKKEIKNNISFISLNHFLGAIYPKSKIAKVLCRFNFVILTIRKIIGSIFFHNNSIK